MSDLIERAKKLLTQCAVHDYGLSGDCGCPEPELDHRAIVAELIAGIERLTDVNAKLAESLERYDAQSFDDLLAEMERTKSVIDALKPWREQFRPASYMSLPAEVLAAAYDAFSAGPGGCAGHTRKPSEVEQPHEFTPYPDNDDRCRVCFGSKDWHWVLERAGHTKAGD